MDDANVETRDYEGDVETLIYQISGKSHHYRKRPKKNKKDTLVNVSAKEYR